LNLRFKRIRLKNFMSYVDSEINLDGQGQVLISGKNNNPLDNAVSNGSGKSTIFNALCWSLTGETLSGISTNVENIYGDPNDCFVELSFDVDSDEFLIKRIKTPKQDLKIYINGVDKSGKGIVESRSILAKYLPDLTSQFIGSIIILGQGLPYRFTDNKPSHRKELLERLTKSDFMISSIKDKLEQRKFELDAKMSVAHDNQIKNTTSTELYLKQLSDNVNTLKEYDEYNSEYTLDSRLDYLNNKIKKLNDEESMYKNDILPRYTSELNELTDSKSSILMDYNNKSLDKLSSIDSEIREIENKYIESNTNCTVLNSEIKRLKSITDICPTCGQKIPGANKVDTTDKERELSELTTSVNSLLLKLDKLKADREILQNEMSEKLSRSMSELDAKIKDHGDLINESNSKLFELQARIQKSITEQAKVQTMKDNYNKVSESISSIKETLDKLKIDKDNIDQDIVEINGHLDVVQEMIKYAKREFRGVLLQSVINYIDKMVKQYSSEVFGTDLLSFTLDENNINITYNNKPYENLSGGEKQKVDIIVQLTLRELLSNQLNIHSNILVIDEVFDNLDSIGCDKILSLINSLNDIESMYIITHHKDTLSITCDTELLIKKDESGISSISIV